MPAEAPYSGSSFDLLKGEWIRLEEPVRRKKEKTAAEPKAKGKQNREYRQLVTAAEQLLAQAKKMDHYANSELRVLTGKIEALLSEYR